MTRSFGAVLGVLLIISASRADDANGWRGNGTGLWPNSRAPIEWQRRPKGIISELRSWADRPNEVAPAKGSPLEKGIVTEWLVLGPIPVQDSVRDFNSPLLPDEASLQPRAGDKVGELDWKSARFPIDDRWTFGPVLAPFADLSTIVGKGKPNQVTYAHAYFHTPKGGTIRAVVDHAFGMKAWLNGKEIYSSPERKMGFGNYVTLSRVEFGSDRVHPSPSFDLHLAAGWNRLLLKITTSNKKGDGPNEQSFLLRLMDMPNIAYETKNILWMAEMPQRSNAAPIVIGDRLFVMAEPDELLCLDKRTGQILWTANNNYYEALTADERDADPSFGKTVDPLLGQLKTATDLRQRLLLRAELQKALTTIDKKRFAWQADGHFQDHFGIVGFASPSPVSDGKHVWAWLGNGVAACYDLDGKRRWIARASDQELSYSASPALADGTLAVLPEHLVGLDAETGKVRWRQKKIARSVGAVLAGTIAGVPVFVTPAGHVVRARDGHLLYRERVLQAGAWGPPVLLGNRICMSRYNAGNLLVLDFDGSSGDEWEPTNFTIEAPQGLVKSPDGKRRDRSTPGSPLVVDDLAYTVDIYSTLYVFDLKAKKFLYHHDTELNGLSHYNAVPVAASPTLVGKHVVIQDNQGLSLALKPGPTFEQVARNHLGTQLERWWPIPSQESIGYAPPVADGGRLYIRGERYLYAIGDAAASDTR